MKLFGLLGETLSYSFSPVIHHTVFESLGIQGHYTLIERDPKIFDEIMFKSMMKSLDGMNVTIPFKQHIIPYLDALHPAAEAIGAVNTVVKKDSKLIGYNTDYFGALESIKMLPLYQVEGGIVLGTGGASKAVIQCLKTLDIKPIYLISRTPKDIYNDSDIHYMDYETLEKSEIKNCLLVNCTPVGMKTHASTLVVKEKLIKAQRCVFDLIYNPKVTPLLKVADEHGIPNINGLNMLIIQAIEADKLWLDVDQIEYSSIIEKVIRKM